MITIETMQVRIDNRVRLMSALLAMTSWPEDEQHRKPHGTHAHARGTRRLLQPMEKHSAVLILQALIDRGMPPETFFTYALQLEWPSLASTDMPTWVPPTFPRHLSNFYQNSGLEQWWEDEADVWDGAVRETEGLFKDPHFRELLQPFVGNFDEALVLLPNVCYPSDTELGLLANGELCCVVPPRIAWGDNPPWPFDEDPAHVYRAALTCFASVLMGRYLDGHPGLIDKVSKKKLPVSKRFRELHPTWQAQFMALLGAGLVAIYLEDHVSSQEAQAFVLMEKKASGLDELPGVISVLRRYLSGFQDGQYAEFADYLPFFAQHLRVAKTITAL
jgi:hypothetical protein